MAANASGRWKRVAAGGVHSSQDFYRSGRSINPSWHVFLVIPNPAWLADPNFVPVRSTAVLDAWEVAHHFLTINPGGQNVC